MALSAIRQEVTLTRLETCSYSTVVQRILFPMLQRRGGGMSYHGLLSGERDSAPYVCNIMLEYCPQVYDLTSLVRYVGNGSCGLTCHDRFGPP